MRVIADSFEEPSGIPDLLRDRRIADDVRLLAAGDYVTGTRIVERKTVLDLHGAIIKARFWPQIGRLRGTSRVAYLLIEGTDLDAGPLAKASVRGACIAVAELGVTVLRSDDKADTADWLRLLAQRESRGRQHRDRPRYAQRPKPFGPTRASEAMLAAVPGISVHSARALLDRFGSVREVAAATAADWLSTPGIGPARADALAQALDHSAGSSSPPPSGGGPGPST